MALDVFDNVPMMYNVSGTSNQPSPLDLANAMDGARLANMLPYAEAEVNKMMEIADTKAYVAIQKGELTPDMAVSLWHEKNAYYRLLRRLSQKVHIGITAGQRAAPALNPMVTQYTSIPTS